MIKKFWSYALKGVQPLFWSDFTTISFYNWIISNINPPRIAFKIFNRTNNIQNLISFKGFKFTIFFVWRLIRKHEETSSVSRVAISKTDTNTLFGFCSAVWVDVYFWIGMEIISQNITEINCLIIMNMMGYNVVILVLDSVRYKHNDEMSKWCNICSQLLSIQQSPLFFCFTWLMYPRRHRVEFFPLKEKKGKNSSLQTRIKMLKWKDISMKRLEDIEKMTGDGEKL